MSETWYQFKLNKYQIGALLSMLGLCILSGVSTYKYLQFKNDNVQTFKHMYEGQSETISFNGPFLGKVRVTGTSIELNSIVGEDRKYSYCNDPSKINNDIKEKCKMMRIPSMRSGKIHASWSLVGAQSFPVLLKHVSLISLAFSFFMLIDLYVRCHPEDTKQTRMLRTLVVFVAIVVSVIDICLDFKTDMHEYENGNQKYAIGSISTGSFFWIASFLIICSSQIDELQEQDWHKHINLNMSYFILLLLPLFMILGLLDFAHFVVDVHIQLIFFSSIFLAVLDIFQMRLMPVLDELGEISFKVTEKDLAQEQGELEFKDTEKNLRKHVSLIRLFVVLACILCKLFVFVPTLQLVGYYIGDNSSFSWAMLAFQIALVCGTCFIDLVYVVMHDIEEAKVYYIFFRTLIIFIIIGGSIAATLAVKVES